MKRTNLIAMMGVMFLSACNNQPSYQIEGSVPEDFPNNTSIYITNLAGDTLNLSRIENHSFSMTGHAEGIEECMICTHTDNQHLIGSLFLENGNIRLDLEHCKVSAAYGTPINDAAFQYYLRKRTLKAEEKLLKQQQKDSTVSAKELKKNELLAEKLQKKNHELIAQTINENIQNPFGVSLLAGYAPHFEVEELQNWIKQIPESYRDKRVAKVQERIDGILKSAVGKKYHEIVGKTPQGQKAVLSDFVGKNKYLLVDFWASWCYPCRMEMGNISKLYKKYHKKGLDVLSISLDTDDYEKKWKDTIKNLNCFWPQIRMDMLSRGHKQYGITSIPFLILLDKNGTIVIRDVRGEELEQKIDELLK